MFKVGDQIKLAKGYDIITAIDRGKDGQIWYQISSGRYVDKCLELVKAAPTSAPVCPVCGNTCTLADHSKYLVLDGYDGRYEKEEPKPKEMTVAEIEKQLGYPVKVVKGEANA